MANISLQGSIRTCKVDPSWASRLESDRFLNPDNMMCPMWQDRDTTGRPVCAGSFYSKQAGCNSASDRVLVENELRPQYMEYINLNAAGITGDPKVIANIGTSCHRDTIKDIYKQTGQFGYNTGFSQNIKSNCLSCKSAQPIIEKYESPQWYKSKICSDCFKN